MPLIALEFDDSRLMVTAAQTMGALKIIGLHEIKMSDMTDEEVGGHLKNYLQSINCHKSEALAIVSRSATEIRELVVPPAPSEELPDMIRFQSRKEFASLGDDWALDYVSLPSGDSGDQNNDNKPSHVLAAALKPELSDRIQTISQSANIKLKRILLRPFAAVNLLDNTERDGKLKLIVDQNLDTVDLTVVRDGQLLATRTVRIPGSLSVDKRTGQLVSEVRRTLVFAKSATGGQQVTDVVISGEESRNRQLAGDLAGPLGMEVHFVDPFQKMAVSARVAAGFESHSERYMAALGGLRKEASGSKPAIDFLNPRRRIVKEVNYRAYWLYSGLAAAAAFIGLFCAWWSLSQQAHDIDEMQTKLNQTIRINEGDDSLPSVEQRLAEIGKIDQWKLQEVNWLVELSEFSKRYLLPDDVIADSFTASLRRDSPATIDLSGRIVDDLKKTEELLHSLGDRPYSVEPIDTGVDKDDRDSKLTSTFEYQIKLLPADESESANVSPMLALDRKALNFLKNQKDSPVKP